LHALVRPAPVVERTGAERSVLHTIRRAADGSGADEVIVHPTIRCPSGCWLPAGR